MNSKDLVKNNSKSKFKVILVGGGHVAHTHIEVLKSIKQIEVLAICDKDLSKAKNFKQQWKIPHAHEKIADLLDEISPDVAHILVPPPLHFSIAKKFLINGISIFIEKPITLSTEDTLKLIDLAKRHHARIGVNHNLLYHPLYLRILDTINKRKIGKIRHVNLIWNMPLRQLQTGDYSNWMFQNTRNIIFEQGPHPFSMICDLMGPASDINVLTTDRKELVHDRALFYQTWQISFKCKKGTAYAFMSFGREFPESRLNVIGEDGSLEIDLVNNLYQMHEKSLWPVFFDSFLDGIQNGSRMALVSTNNLFNYSLSLFRFQKRTDSFYLCMKKSIENFYNALENNKPIRCSGEDAIKVIQCCEKCTENFPDDAPRKNNAKPAQTKFGKEEILIIGGTGFIGKHLTRKLIEAGHRLRVMTRNPHMIPNEITHPLVRVMQGDIRDPRSIARAVDGVSIVYYLALGGGESWDEINATEIGGLRIVTDICQEHKIKQFHFASSISALYLGDRHTATEETPIDEYYRIRGPYARAKIECEHLLMKMYHLNKFPSIIYRPAVVVGKWGRPYHGAVGFWVNDRHCIGWSKGLNPLPFVLVEDVATALMNAMTKEGISGKSFLLAGDVRLSAQKYVELLGDQLQRDIRFHPRPSYALQLKEIVKWLIKIGIKHPNSEFPSYRDLKTRALLSDLDCSQTKEILNWKPTSDVNTFIQHGIRCY
jgi:predicted dehydrogenase/nucleoside-diphosphate-sugar epimerase